MGIAYSLLSWSFLVICWTDYDGEQLRAECRESDKEVEECYWLARAEGTSIINTVWCSVIVGVVIHMQIVYHAPFDAFY